MSAVAKQKNTLKPHFDAVAVYDLLRFALRPDLADYRGVLASLHGGGDGAFLLQDLKQWLVPDSWPEDAPKVLAMLDGSHPSGFRLSIIKAAGDGRREVAMPMIEDPYTHRTLAVGPAPLPEKLAIHLEKAGITYVAGNDQMARAAITNFLISTVQERVEMQKTGSAPFYFRDGESTLRFVEDFMMATLSTADFGAEAALLENPRTNIADLLLPISQGRAEATIYTAAAKKAPVMK